MAEIAVPENREALLETLAVERRAWEALLDDARSAPREEPGVVANWSLKDLLAHIAGWERLAADDALSVTRGEPFAHGDLATWSVDQLNATFVEQGRAKSLGEIENEAAESHRALLAALDRLSDVQLAIRGRYPWSAEGTVARFLAENSYLHYHEHIDQIRAWLARDGQTG